MTQHATGFRKLYATTEHRQSVCVLALLSWVSACDGSIADPERELLARVAESVGVTAADELATVTRVGESGDVEDLLLACNFLARIDRGGRRLLAELAITMSVQDGHLAVGENHALQFVADLLGIRPRSFAKLFERVTHRPFPLAGDPSSPEWWRVREAGESAHAPADNWGPERPGEDDLADEAADGPMPRTLALRILGLRRDASSEQVHAAYRKLARSRHPDRFARLGPAAVATATEAFERLRTAYEVASAPVAPSPVVRPATAGATGEPL